MIKTVSATSLRMYQDCPHCWYLKYELGLIPPISDALEIGKAFHKIVELYHSGVGEEEIILKLKKEIITEPLDELIDRFSIIRKLAEIYFKEPLKSQTKETEKKFYIPLEKCSLALIGFIDRVTEEGIIEYKTTSKDYIEDDLKSIQTDIYSFAINKLTKEIPEITYYVINKNKLKDKEYKPQILKIKRTQEDIDKIEDICAQFHQNVLDKKFEPKQGNPCFWCPFKEQCKKYGFNKSTIQ